MSDFSNNILTNITADVYTASLGFTAAASFLGGAQFMLGAFGFLYYIFGMNREQHNTETTASNRKGGTVMENGLMNLQFRIVKLILNSACKYKKKVYWFLYIILPFLSISLPLFTRHC